MYYSVIVSVVASQGSNFSCRGK